MNLSTIDYIALGAIYDDALNRHLHPHSIGKSNSPIGNSQFVVDNIAHEIIKKYPMSAEDLINAMNILHDLGHESITNRIKRLLLMSHYD